MSGAFDVIIGGWVLICVFIIGFMLGNQHYLDVKKLELLDVSADEAMIECRAIDYPHTPKIRFRR